MKNVIKLAVMMVALTVAASASAAQATGSKQTPPPAKPAPAAPAKKAPDAPMKMEEPKSPCKAGEALKDAKKPFDAKTNPCVKKK